MLYCLQNKICSDKYISEHMINENPRTNVGASLSVGNESNTLIWCFPPLYLLGLEYYCSQISVLLFGYYNSDCSAIELGIVYLMHGSVVYNYSRETCWKCCGFSSLIMILGILLWMGSRCPRTPARALQWGRIAPWVPGSAQKRLTG